MSEELTNNNFLNSFLNKIKQNKKKIFIAVFITILVILFFYYLNYNNKKKHSLISENFNKAKNLLVKNEKETSKEILTDIINKKNNFYSPMSLYVIIENNLINDQKEIIKLFDRVISIRNIDQEDLDLIKIKKAIYLFDNITEDEILKILKPITNSNSAWKSNAIKLLIDYYKSKGENQKAQEFEKLLLNINN